MRATTQGRSDGTHSCRPANTDFVPSPCFQVLEKVPGLHTAGRRLRGKLHGKLRGQDCLQRRQDVQTEVVYAGPDIGKDDRAGAEEYGLLDVGIHRPDLCDDAEQPGQDAHLWRADLRGKVSEREVILSRGPEQSRWVNAVLRIASGYPLGGCLVDVMGDLLCGATGNRQLHSSRGTDVALNTSELLALVDIPATKLQHRSTTTRTTQLRTRHTTHSDTPN